MTSYGIKIAEAGASITSSNNRDFVMNSKYGFLKIVLQGTATFSFTAAQTVKTFSIVHGQPVIPSVLCFYELETGEVWQHFHIENFIAPTAHAPQLDGVNAGCSTSVNESELNMRIDLSGAHANAFTAYGYYFIFADPGG